MRRRLAKALRLEAYFRVLHADSRDDEVLRQWRASRRLVSSVVDEFSALGLPLNTTGYSPSGTAG